MASRSSMMVGVLQYAPTFGDVRGNLEKLEAMIAPTRAELFVAPELALSGYTFESREEAAALAQDPAASQFDGLARIARAKGATVVVGFAERAGSFLFNSSLLIAPDGSRAVYRKIHLFDRERLFFTPGDRAPSIVEVAGVRIGMMICFDWIFPELARSLAIQGADILCHPANLVLPYCQDAMITRCIENRLFAATANRTGIEERAGQRLAFTGTSQIVAQNGRVLARASGDRDEVLVAEIAPWDAREKWITPSNHVLADRRPLLYTLGAVETPGP
jgi:predicted amidohydrolase